jgi:serine/threonine protein kinase
MLLEFLKIIPINDVHQGEGTDGKELAVKVLHHFAVDFDKILTTSAKVKHPNIMQLLAYCKETKMEYENHDGNIIRVPKVYWALCFEYMHNGSLRQYIYGTMLLDIT